MSSTRKRAFRLRPTRRGALRFGLSLVTVVVLLGLGNFSQVITWFAGDSKALFEQANTTWEEDRLLPLFLESNEHESAPASRVSAIGFGSGALGYLQGNPCDGREFMAELIRDLQRQDVRIIVIDKFYPRDSCSDQARNRSLFSAMQESPATIIVGRKVDEEPGRDDQWTLQYTDRKEPGSYFLPGNVLGRLIQFNHDIRKIPLRWPVQDVSAQVDTIAYAAAKIKDPAVEDDLSSFLVSRRQPMMEDPHVREHDTIPAEQILCRDAKTEYPNRPRALTCKDTAPLTLRSIVVIGDPSDADLFRVAGDPPVYGYQIQARYIESLLGRTFFKEFPATAWNWVFFSLCVLTQMVVAFHEPKRLSLSFSILVISLVFSYVLGWESVRLHFYPPVEGLFALVLNGVTLFLLDVLDHFSKSGERDDSPAKAHAQSGG